jgi:hypothetical protein
MIFEALRRYEHAASRPCFALPSGSLANVGQFGDQAGTTAIPDFGGKFPHRFLSDDAAFTARQGSAGVI